MKFGKKLQQMLDHCLPGWKTAFLNYKLLKKRLKSVGTSFGSTAPMTLLTCAIQIMDNNPPTEDEVLIPVIPVTGPELSDGDDSEGEVGQKRKAGNDFRLEERKKRKSEVGSEEEVQEQGQSPSRHLTEEDEDFLRLVKIEVHKFNAFFLEKEEEFLIRLLFLEEKTDKLKEKRKQSCSGVCDRLTYQQIIQAQRQIVSMHGELVLLMNYSSLNYIGLLKILKKYDKHTKSNLRQLVHASVLQQPFVSITNLKEMIARSLSCGESLESILPTPGDVVEPLGAGLARDVAAHDVSQSEPMARQIRAALHTMQEIQ